MSAIHRYARIPSESISGSVTITPGAAVLPVNTRRALIQIQNISGTAKLLYYWGEAPATAAEWFELDPGVGGMLTASIDELYLRSDVGTANYVIQTFRGT